MTAVLVPLLREAVQDLTLPILLESHTLPQKPCKWLGWGLLATVLGPIVFGLHSGWRDLASIWCVTEQGNEQLTPHLMFVVAKQANQRNPASTEKAFPSPTPPPKLFARMTAVLAVFVGVLTACGSELLIVSLLPAVAAEVVIIADLWFSCIRMLGLRGTLGTCRETATAL